MDTLFTGVRKGDVVLAALLTALGVVLMVADVRTGPGSETRIDSQSWWMVPVFAAATLPILWRRRNLVAVVAVTAVALAVHDLAFGWVVRCGAGLPLSIALAYAAGRLADGRRSVGLLLGTVVVQALVLLRDSAAGSEILPVTAVLAAAAWGSGVWLRRRSASRAAVDAADPAVSYA